ncbi:GmrSD restriction endonuclease domain-containing protein [Streptomyces sp. BH104]|uniref:GmrSD restriction endonuclease domain-containing protein n=1 Tax=Streptomyces sp. BH104 TaxID=3410407 RepID=UPI003BB4BE5C
MSNSPIDGRGYTIEQLFGHRFRLDPYQREYTWSTDDVRRLLHDLKRRFLHSWSPEHTRESVGRYSPYFLGPYVFYQSDGISFLVDGQQRVTTLHLLLIHVRRLLIEQEHQLEADQLGRLISSVQYGRRTFAVDIAERAPLLEALFEAKTYELSSEENPSVRNLWARSRDIEEEFPTELLGDALPYFHDWLLSRVGLVGIEALDRANGWEIFETMNDRGTRLSPVDLLKSYLLAESDPDQRDSLNASWRQMLTGLVAVENVIPAEFVKTLLLARHATIDDNSTDIQQIEASFHEWIRNNSRRIGLTGRAEFARFITSELKPLAEGFAMLRRAAMHPKPGLESVYYNEVNGISDQYRLILAALEPDDGTSVQKEKSKLVADFLDLFFVHQLIGGYAPQGADMGAVVDNLVPLVRPCRSTDQLARTLAAELPAGDLFPDFGKYRLRADNRRQVRYLLARLTSFAEVGVGEPNRVHEYLSETKPYQVEHIWAVHFERYKDLVKTRDRFEEIRNRLGGLLLLHQSDNASYGDDPYVEKLEHYQRQNILAAALHPTTHKRNPRFQKFLKEAGLQGKMRPYPNDFTVEANEDRQQLYKLLAEAIWSPERLGLSRKNVLPAQRKSAPTRSTTRAYYGVGISQLMEYGILKPGTRLNPGKRPTTSFAEILTDGRIRTHDGQVFSALSPAGAHVRGTKASPGWDFWHIEQDGKLAPIKVLRDEFLKAGR